MSLFIPPVVRATDANGLPLSGAKWYFYLTGTTTAESVYTTSALDVAHPNPVVADAGGLFVPIFLDPAVTYRAILKTAAGSTIQDIDPYSPVDPPRRVIYAAAAPYLIAADGSDETSKLQSLFADIQSGDTVIFPEGGSQITSKLTLGNGTDTTRSSINGVTLIFPPGSHAQAFIATTTIPKSGYYFEWAGSAGGTMMEWAGPINGIRVIGALQLDGANIAAKGLEGYSFSHCLADEIAVYNCTSENIRLDTRDATTIESDTNGITSADNYFSLISSFSPDNAGAKCLVVDGYEIASGQDVTGTKFGVLRLGWNGANGIGLWLGFTDFIQIDQLISINYGSVTGSGSPLFLDSSSLPFEAPTTATIGWFASTGGTVTGGTNGQVYIENYSIDEGGTIPTGITGLNIRRVHSTVSANNGQTRGSFQRPVVSTIADGDGWYGKDGSGTHYVSLTRLGTAAHVGAQGDVEFEAGATSGPTSAKHFKVTTNGAGYPTGVGGTVTQATSKSTGVTLNKVCGQVTMNNAALASAAKVSFVVTNSTVAATDMVVANVVSGGTANAYRAAVTAVGAGSFTVTVENITGGSLSEAPVIGFAVIKAVAA